MFAGSAGVAFGLESVASGGVSLTGEAAAVVGLTAGVSGGIEFGGTAAVEEGADAHTYVATGGITLGGTAAAEATTAPAVNRGGAGGTTTFVTQQRHYTAPASVAVGFTGSAEASQTVAFTAFASVRFSSQSSAEVSQTVANEAAGKVQIGLIGNALIEFKPSKRRQQDEEIFLMAMAA
jgi:hypothetical protein